MALPCPYGVDCIIELNRYKDDRQQVYNGLDTASIDPFLCLLPLFTLPPQLFRGAESSFHSCSNGDRRILPTEAKAKAENCVNDIGHWLHRKVERKLWLL